MLASIHEIKTTCVNLVARYRDLNMLVNFMADLEGKQSLQDLVNVVESFPCPRPLKHQLQLEVYHVGIYPHQSRSAT